MVIQKKGSVVHLLGVQTEYTDAAAKEREVGIGLET
jgi:hypothetical protein